MGKEVLTFEDNETEKKNLPPLKSYSFKRCRYEESISI